MNIKIAVLAVIVVLAGCTSTVSDEQLIDECTAFVNKRMAQAGIDATVKEVFIMDKNLASVSYGFDAGFTLSVYCGVSLESKTVFTSRSLSEVQEYLAL